VTNAVNIIISDGKTALSSLLKNIEKQSKIGLKTILSVDELPVFAIFRSLKRKS
jgi:hypothetical protein